MERPDLNAVHAQLRVRFQWLRELLIEYGVEVKYDESTGRAIIPTGWEQALRTPYGC